MKITVPSFSGVVVNVVIAVVIVILVFPTLTAARDHHVIKFQSPNLYPKTAAYDPTAQHFIVASLRHRAFHSVSDAGVISHLLTDTSLPENSTILGLAVDTLTRRLLATITSPGFTALAAYDLRSLTPLFLAHLPSHNPSSTALPDVASDVAVDFSGNAYITNSANDFIWKVDSSGHPSVFSTSPLFTAHESLEGSSSRGLTGIHYVSKGYLLVVQSNTGRLFKVDAVDGTVRGVIVNNDLDKAEGIILRSDGSAVVVSPVNGVWVVKSDDSFGEGRVVERVEGDKEGYPTGLVVGGAKRVYLVYGYLEEGMVGNMGREWFRMEELKESGGDDNVWVFVLIGLGLVYFTIWRFQMTHLVRNLDKKVQ